MSIQDKFNKANVIYKITRDIDLGGETLTIPEGCTLDFQGGSFSNGELKCTKTSIRAISSVFSKISISGTLESNYIHSSWFGVKESNETNDTELTEAILACNNVGLPLFLDKGTYKVSTSIHLPKYGIKGVTSKLSILTYTGAEDIDDIALFVYGKAGHYSYQSNIEDISFSVEDDNITNDVVAICTPSRGARMKDCGITTGSGACVAMYECFYYEFNNVAFNGRWRAEGIGYKGRGFVFGKDGSEINNITFNKCDFKDLQDLCIINLDIFKGSNAISINNTAIERLGRGLGNLNTMNIVFDSCYIEGLCKDGDYDNYSIAKTGAGDVTFKDCLLNFSSVPADKPLFFTLIGDVYMDNNTINLPKDFSSTILANPHYSSKGRLYIENQDVTGYNAKYVRHISDRSVAQYFDNPLSSSTVYSSIKADSLIANKTTELILRRAERQYNSTAYWTLEKKPYQLAIDAQNKYYLEIDVKMAIFYEASGDYVFVNQSFIGFIGGVTYLTGDEILLKRVKESKSGAEYLTNYDLIKLVVNQIKDNLVLFDIVSPQISFAQKHDGIAKNMYSDCKLRIIPFDGEAKTSAVF